MTTMTKEAGTIKRSKYSEERIAYATSPAAVENWAYDKGHMVRPGDVPVVDRQPDAGGQVPGNHRGIFIGEVMKKL